MPFNHFEVSAALGTQFDAIDQEQLERIERELRTSTGQFVQEAELLGIEPNPVPHVHRVHSELHNLCSWAYWLFTIVGIGVTAFLTAGAAESPVLTSIIAAAAFVVLEFAVRLGIASLWEKRFFIEHFQYLYTPFLLLLLAGATVLLLGRFASENLAAVLIELMTYAWWSIEFALLFLGALSLLGWRRFGWSDVLTREITGLEQEISTLLRRMDRRESNRKLIVGVAVVVMALCCAPAALGQCSSVMIDRTGSVAFQTQVEQSLTATVASRAAEIGCIKLILFGSDALNAPSKVVRWNNASAHTQLFKPLATARAAAVRKQAEISMAQVLSDAPQADLGCTSFADIAARSSKELGSVIVVTDGIHDCPEPAFRDRWETAHVTVVLVPAKRDTASVNRIDLVNRRGRMVRRYLPHAKVLSLSELCTAVASLPPAADPHALCGTR